MQSINIDMPDAEYYSVDNPDALMKVVREVADTPIIALDTETTGLSKTEAMPLFWSLSWGLPERANRVCMRIETLKFFKDSFADPDKIWVFANAKFDMHMLANVGTRFAGFCADIQVMHSLLYEEMPHALKFIMKHLFGWSWQAFNETFPPQKDEGVGERLLRVWEQDPTKLIEYASDDAYGTMLAYWELEKRLEEEPTIKMLDMDDGTVNLLDVFWEVEVPYTKVLWDCERKGAKIDTARLKEIQKPLESGIKQLERDIMRSTGGVVQNPNSNKQWGTYLYDHKSYPILKRTKGGKKGIRAPSTDADVRKRLFELTQDEALKHADKHAKLTKLYGTYVMGLQNRLTPRGYVHTNFNQQVARTGRLTCVHGNTKLATPGGLVLIKDLKPGEQVWTHKKRWRRVLDVFTKGMDYMVDVHLSNGEILTCTRDHLVLTTEGWMRVGEVIHEHLEEVGEHALEHFRCFEPIPLQASADDTSNSRTARRYVSQCSIRTEEEHVRKGKESTGKSTLFCVEDCRKESNEGGLRRSTPSVEGGMQRRSGVPNLYTQQQKAVCTQGGNGTSTRFGGVACTMGGAPYRQRYQEQHPGQSSPDNEVRARRYTLLAGKGLDTVTVKKVHYRGRFEVYDLTVEEDASYEACGIFSHNSSDPNMQNWPRRDEDEYKLRDALICEAGHSILVFDYAQLEMRILADMAQEQAMIDMIIAGRDIHMGNASIVFDIPYEDIYKAKKFSDEEWLALTKEEIDYYHYCLFCRQAAKAIGFGLNYGMKENSVAARLGISKADAKEKMDQYLATYPAVKAFFDTAVVIGQDTGFAFTYLGRRRRLVDIHSTSTMMRWNAERIASNVPIQGGAADIVKRAMINISDARMDKLFGYEMFHQVHDEILGTCPTETSQAAAVMLKEIMEHPLSRDLLVPLPVDGGIAQSWGEAK